VSRNSGRDERRLGLPEHRARSLVASGSARENFRPAGALCARALRADTGVPYRGTAACLRSNVWMCMTAPVLTFLAPPSLGGADDSDDGTVDAYARVKPSAGPGRPPQKPNRGPAAVRMTRGAREAATGMKVSDADVRRCLDAPDDVTPDDTTPSRTRFRRGTLVVLAGADGMVLRVQRRGR